MIALNIYYQRSGRALRITAPVRQVNKLNKLNSQTQQSVEKLQVVFSGIYEMNFYFYKTITSMSKLYLGLGSNSGEREKYLTSAISLINKHIGKVIVLSPVYESVAWGFKSEHMFLNQVVLVDTALKVFPIMNHIAVIEKELGRIKPPGSYADRTIDIDILFFEDKVLNTENVIIPHPLLQERRFVLRPLVDIAPDLFHPVIKKSVRLMLDECLDQSKVTRLIDKKEGNDS
jgi:2-amino-4-hydroxy-6-hydroxymethyldihydropteridine diphosphokinase